MSCNQTQQVQAFHDGEMDSAVANAFELHLMNCSACAKELDELRRLSTHLAGAAIPTLSSDALSRFHGAVKVVEERGVLRLAEWLTAAAAAILLVGVIGLFKHDDTHARSPDAWEQAAVAYPTYADSLAQNDTLQLAEWIRTDLSGLDKR